MNPVLKEIFETQVYREIRSDKIERSHYAFGVLLAVAEARLLPICNGEPPRHPLELTVDAF